MNTPKETWVEPKVPKEIWLDENLKTHIEMPIQYWAERYIRADLVDGLVEALELSAFHMHKITTARGKADYSVVRDALAALKEEE